MYGENELSNEELSEFLVQELELVQVLGEVAVLTELSDHVQVLGRLEGVDKLEQKGVLQGLHDLGFGDGVLYLLVLNQELLLHGFGSQDEVGFPVLDLEDAAEGTLSYELQNLEILEFRRVA